MNKAITDGLVLTPPTFSNGLNVWSSGNGTPGSDTYAGSGTGVFVPADQNFTGCIEISKSQTVQRLRYMGETPILPGCYLRISTRVKVVAGPLPTVRIAGWAGKSGGQHMDGVDETGPEISLTQYGQVVEISAIVGTGPRDGVDMVWTGALYGHFGLDILGSNGAVVRVDDIQIEDVTSVFIRDMMGVVDVRDYGAKGDGVTDDSAAFEAADADAHGREVLVSAGHYKLKNHVTIENQIRFEGTVSMAADKRLIFQKNFDYATYADAFGDEEVAFKKAFQALLNFSDHDSLDLCGRRIALTGPVDMQAAEGSRTSYAIRRVIRNGQLEAKTSTKWDTKTVTSKGTYSASQSRLLTNVNNVANIEVGSLVTGNGVGREIYVSAKNVGQKTVTLSQPLFDAEGTQTFTFKRFAYLIDFSGFEALQSFVFDDIEFACNGLSSGVMMAKNGGLFQLRDCTINKPKDRGVTSIDRACQGLMFDRCQFLSNEQSTPVADRHTIGFNANANDVKIRDCRVIRFKHFCLLGGSGSLITGNHWFLGDGENNGVRTGGVVIALPNCNSIITGNYIDNNSIEWTNEYDATPAMGQQFSFGGLTVTGNIFTASNVGNWFRFIVVKPYGPGHFLHGFAVTGNSFRVFGAGIERVEKVDTTYADLDYGRFRNVSFTGNTFNAVSNEIESPAIIEHNQSTESAGWLVETQPRLPFGGYARCVEAVTAQNAITSGNAPLYAAPHASIQQGNKKTKVRLDWPKSCKGKVRVRVRCDNPL